MTHDVTRPKKRPSAVSKWYFTWNNYPEDYLEHLPKADTVKYAIYGKEEAPTTGTPHIQGYFTLLKEERHSTLSKKYPEAAKFFQKADGTPYQNYIYCSKENNFLEYGERPKAPKNKAPQTKHTLKRALEEDCTYEEAITLIREEEPLKYLIHAESIERTLKKLKRTPFEHKHRTFLQAPINNLRKVTLVYGPTGTGKTAYALNHFENPLLVSHIDKLKKFEPGYHDGIVFDDMSFVHWPPEAVIHLLDMDYARDINVRYATAIIPEETRKIFTHNTYNPFYDDKIPEESKEAIERRLERVHVLNKLF